MAKRKPATTGHVHDWRYQHSTPEGKVYKCHRCHLTETRAL